MCTETLKNALLKEVEITGYSVCECLAELVKDALITDELDPLHVDGIEFMQCCDRVLVQDS